jgi:hypothetical protein
MFMEVFMNGAWSIWKEMNNLLFNVVIPSTESKNCGLCANTFWVGHDM